MAPLIEKAVLRNQFISARPTPKAAEKALWSWTLRTGYSLHNRLKDHATSIKQAANLQLADFLCRYLVVDDIWLNLGERRAIQKYLPLWNTLIDGFGNHDPGVRRKRPVPLRLGCGVTQDVPGLKNWGIVPRRWIRFFALLLRLHLKSNWKNLLPKRFTRNFRAMMDEARLVKISKYLCKHLRHQPEQIGLTLAPGGWVGVDDLLAACAANNVRLSRAELEEVVAGNSKQRFAFDESGNAAAGEPGAQC